MRPSKFIRFCLCFAFVFKTVLSSKTNVTGSDGKVFISGDRIEVVVSTAREAKINLVDKGTSKGESMNKENMKFLTKLHALDKRVKSMEKIEKKPESDEPKCTIFVQNNGEGRSIDLEETQGLR